jgi:hypothetical protein
MAADPWLGDHSTVSELSEVIITPCCQRTSNDSCFSFTQ